jgi:Bax protein
MKYFLSILAIMGIYLIAFTEIKQAQTVSKPLEITIHVQPASIKPVVVPVIDTSNKDTFVQTLNACVNHIYSELPVEQQIPKEILIAQAALETGWGSSRFANEGNNLFGIRTFNKDSEWLLPITWDQNKWIGWGVKVYETKCQSVKDYVRIINTVFAYEKFRELRSQNANVYELVDTLDKYATKNSYTELVKKVIKYNIEGKYEL